MEQKDVDWIRDVYIENFLENSKKNYELANLSFFTILSQLPIFGFDSMLIAKRKIRNEHEIIGKNTTGIIDTRIHTTYLAPTGTGKTQAKKFIVETLFRINSFLKDELKITYEAIDGSQTDISWVGSMQVRKGKEKDEIVETEGILKRFKNGGIIIGDEAMTILKVLDNKEDKTLHYLNLAMDNFTGIKKIGNYLTRSTVQGKVEYHTFPSFIFLTHLPEKKKKDFDIEKIINTGFIQRQIFLYKEMDIDERKRLIEDIVNSISTPIKINTKDYANALKEIANVRKWCYKNRGKIIYVNDNSILKEFTERYMSELIDKNNDTIKGEIYTTIYPRLIDIIIKIGAGYSILNKRTKIIRDDIEKATNIVWENYIYSLQYAIDTHIKDDIAKDLSLYRKLKKIEHINNKLLTASELRDIITKSLNYSTATYYRKIKEWKKKGYLQKIDGKYKLNVNKILEELK